MPLYRFVCDKCNTSFELLVRCGTTPLCPDCGSEKLTRQLSTPSVPKASDGAGCGCGEHECCRAEHPHAGGCGCGGCCGHHPH